MPTVGDPYVYNVQQWVNEHFTGETGYTPITENGQTGWTTIYALLHALQISLGLSSTANNFGPGTESAYSSYIATKPLCEIDPDSLVGPYETMTLNELEAVNLNNLSPADQATVLGLIKYKRICGIIQGALLCKGYSIGTNKPTGNFYSGTGNSIKNLKNDAGIDNSTSYVTLNIMKALMSMDYFYSYDNSPRTQNIISMQRYLNSQYEDYIGLCPCDGIYGRRTSKAMVYALQAEEGMPVSIANGNFGPSTKSCCPTIPYNNVETNYQGVTYTTNSINRIKKLLNIALYFNGFGYGLITNTYYSEIVRSFQNRHALPLTGICNLTTWLSIYISCGDVNRSAIACDCATPLTQARAQTLYNNGYRYVGRYITGTTKKVSIQEMNIAFNAGLRIFPIYQTSADYVEYFTANQGEADALSAYNNAIDLNIPQNTVIYFAVDCDPQDPEITSAIIPYFSSLHSKMQDLGRYKVGIYGTRNVCNRVSNLGYASYSFVGDMSTGFSGNLGFIIPSNWAFDQFTTISVGSGDGYIEIDKDACSGRDLGIDHLDSSPTTGSDEPDYSLLIGKDSNYADLCINKSNNIYNVYLYKNIGSDEQPALGELNIVMNELNEVMLNPETVNDYGVANEKVGEILPGDLYVRFGCQMSSSSFPNRDSVHKVIFKNADGNVRYGYMQEILFQGDIGLNDSRRYLRERFIDYNFDPNSNCLVVNTNIVDEDDREYTVTRELNVINTSGESIGTIQPGTKLKGYGGLGATHKDFAYFEYKQDVNSNIWNYLDSDNGAFVDLDMKHGVNGYDRALW